MTWAFFSWRGISPRPRGFRGWRRPPRLKAKGPSRQQETRSGARRGSALPKDAGEGRAFAARDHEPEEHRDGARQYAAGVHQRVEKEDVDDDRGDQRERQRHVAADEEKHGAEDLQREDEVDVVGGGQDPDELAGQAGGHRALREEVEETVQAEDEEQEAEQDARDEGCDFHGGSPAT